MRRLLPSILIGLLAGTCDTAGFLALNKLFTTHITGNLVLAGAAWATSGQVKGNLGRLIAIPVFLGAVWLGRLAAESLRRRGLPALRCLLAAMMLLMVAYPVLGLTLGPFATQDTPGVIITGMAGVVAMALLNVALRLWHSVAVNNTALTGTSVQIMTDLAELALGQRRHEPNLRSDSGHLAATVLAFVGGCALSALVYVAARDWCMAVPLVFAAWLTALWPRDSD